jgi:glucokinase
MTSILGLDIGGTKTAVVEGTYKGEILQRYENVTEAWKRFATTQHQWIEALKELEAQAKRAGRSPNAISISVGGPLKIAEGVLLDPPHLAGWHGVNLKQWLNEYFPHLPVFVEHDGNAGALAEFHFGVGRTIPNLRHLIFLTFGTGLGAGLIMNGQILRGATDTAGEVGHWRLAKQGPIGYGKAGSWEGFASGNGLVTLAAEMFPQKWTQSTPIRSLVEAMLRNEPETLQVCEAAGEKMGQGIALLVDALNPQAVVIGTLGRVLGERIFAPIRRVIEAECLPQAAAACAILPSALGEKLGDVAALMAAINPTY